MICRWQARGRIWERGVSLSWGSTNALPHGGLCPNHSCHTVHAVTGKFLRRIDPPAAPPPRPALVTIGTEVGRVFARDDAGQTVVLVALMFTVLMGFAALGFDVIVEPHNLIDGILPVTTNGRGCRVAITVAVPTFLIKIISPALNTITMTTQGYAKSKSGMLPTVVTRYANPPGPGL